MPKEQEVSLIKLIERSYDEEKCRAYLEGLRWPDGITCPRCGSDKISRIKTRGQLDCDSCRYRFSVTAGTIFHDTHLPLWKWLVAVYLIVASNKGVSANQLKRTIEVSYKTAWYLVKRIRAALEEVNVRLLFVIVEMNGIKGSEIRSKERTYRGNETAVDAASNAGDTSTEKWPNYWAQGERSVGRRTLKQGDKEGATKNDVDTNSTDDAWSFLERSDVAAYYNFHAKHLDAYMVELQHRLNDQENPYMFRDTLWKLLVAGNLSYKELTSEEHQEEAHLRANRESSLCDPSFLPHEEVWNREGSTKDEYRGYDGSSAEKR